MMDTSLNTQTKTASSCEETLHNKLLFFDIDGTLLDEKTRTIPESAKLALKMAKENGHYIFINTGRPISLVNSPIRELDFDGYLCGCGTYILFRDDVLFHNILSKDVQQSIIDLFLKYNLQGALEGTNDVFFPHTEEEQTHPKVSGFIKNYEQNNHYVKYFDDANVDFDKFVIFTGYDFPKTKEYERLIHEISKNFDVIDREEDLMEFIPLGFSKATCIDFMCKHLNASLDDCYVFGDSTNDTAMLTHVSHSIGMGNSMEEILDLVSYVTTPTYEDGIYLAMKHFHLI